MKLNLTESQREVIGTLLQEATMHCLSINFNEPNEDQLRLRQHAYIKGKLNGFTSVLNHDELQQQAEAEQAKIREQQAQANVVTDVQ